jgi:hypothetical protein
MLLLNHSGAIRLIVAFLRVIDQPDNQLAKYEAFTYLYSLFTQNSDVVVNSPIFGAVESTDANDFCFSERGFHFDAFKLQSLVYTPSPNRIIRTRIYLNKCRASLPCFSDLTLDFARNSKSFCNDFHCRREKKAKIYCNRERCLTHYNNDHSPFERLGIPNRDCAVCELGQPDLRTGSRLAGGRFWKRLITKNLSQIRIKITGVCVLPRHRKSSLLKHRNEQYQSEEEALFIEKNLNMPYVAFTRPTDKLYIYASRNHFKDSGCC